MFRIACSESGSGCLLVQFRGHGARPDREEEEMIRNAGLAREKFEPLQFANRPSIVSASLISSVSSVPHATHRPRSRGIDRTQRCQNRLP